MFIEALLGSGLANALTLKATADAFNEELARSDIVNRPQSTARTGIQKELLDRANKKIEVHKSKEAIPLLIRAIKLDPYYQIYYFILGNCYGSLGQFDIALECFDKALDLEGKVYVTTENFRKAVRRSSKMSENGLNATERQREIPIKGEKTGVDRKSTIKRVNPRTKGDDKKSNDRGR